MDPLPSRCVVWPGPAKSPTRPHAHPTPVPCFPRIHMVMKASIFPHTHSGPSRPHNGPSIVAPPPVGFSQGREGADREEESPAPNPHLILGISQPEPAVLGLAPGHPPLHSISSSTNGGDTVTVSNSVCQASYQCQGDCRLVSVYCQSKEEWSRSKHQIRPPPHLLRDL